jgi:hypothetical protein
MIETFFTWFLIGTAIKVIYEMNTSKAGRRRAKDQASDLLAVVAVIVTAVYFLSPCSGWLSDLDICLYGFGSHTPKFDSRIELCRVKHWDLESRRLTAEAPDAPRAIEKTQRGQSTPRLADHKRCDQRASGGGILLHQAFQCDRELMDCIWRRQT